MITDKNLFVVLSRLTSAAGLAFEVTERLRLLAEQLVAVIELLEKEARDV
jgi:hypothetical protein